MLHPVKKQVYKLEIQARWKIYNIFHISLLKKNNTKKEQMNKFLVLEFKADNNKEYKVEAI